MEDTGSDSVVPLPNVHSRTLARVMEYAQKHAEKAGPPTDEVNTPSTSEGNRALEEWDKVLRSASDHARYMGWHQPIAIRWFGHLVWTPVPFADDDKYKDDISAL